MTEVSSISNEDNLAADGKSKNQDSDNLSKNVFEKDLFGNDDLIVSGPTKHSVIDSDDGGELEPLPEKMIQDVVLDPAVQKDHINPKIEPSPSVPETKREHDEQVDTSHIAELSDDKKNLEINSNSGVKTSSLDVKELNTDTKASPSDTKTPSTNITISNSDANKTPAFDMKTESKPKVLNPPPPPWFKPGRGRKTNQLQFLDKTVIKAVSKHKYAWPFLTPVDAAALMLPVRIATRVAKFFFKRAIIFSSLFPNQKFQRTWINSYGLISSNFIKYSTKEIRSFSFIPEKLLEVFHLN